MCGNLLVVARCDGLSLRDLLAQVQHLIARNVGKRESTPPTAPPRPPACMRERARAAVQFQIVAVRDVPGVQEL
jgi:hypothetical protein